MAVAAPMAVSPHVKRVPSKACVTGEYPGSIVCVCCLCQLMSLTSLALSAQATHVSAHITLLVICTQCDATMLAVLASNLFLFVF